MENVPGSIASVVPFAVNPFATRSLVSMKILQQGRQIWVVWFFSHNNLGGFRVSFLFFFWSNDKVWLPAFLPPWADHSPLFPVPSSKAPAYEIFKNRKEDGIPDAIYTDSNAAWKLDTCWSRSPMDKASCLVMAGTLARSGLIWKCPWGVAALSWSATDQLCPASTSC